jgi:hypothetical protein
MGVRFIFNQPEVEVCLLICRRTSSGRPAFSPVLLEELSPARRHVERRDPQIGNDRAVGLVAISAQGWGRDLGSAGKGGYSVNNCRQWVRDGGRILEKKYHAAM